MVAPWGVLYSVSVTELQFALEYKNKRYFLQSHHQWILLYILFIYSMTSAVLSHFLEHFSGVLYMQWLSQGLKLSTFSLREIISTRPAFGFQRVLLCGTPSNLQA